MLLNLSPDHLDQYNYNYEEYALAKFRIAENQENDNYFIYNKDDEMSIETPSRTESESEKIPFSMKENLNEGGYSVDENLVVKLREEFSMKIEDLATRRKAQCSQ